MGLILLCFCVLGFFWGVVGVVWCCVWCAVTAMATKGAIATMVHCTVRENGNSGIRAQEDSTIHIYGNKTSIDSNCSRISRTQKDRSGLFTSDTSTILIHEPLSLACSHDNISGNDTKGSGIKVVP